VRSRAAGNVHLPRRGIVPVRLLALVVLAAVAAAGCLGGGGGRESGPAAGPASWSPGERPEGARAYDQLYGFAMDHPNRRGADPQAMEAARQYLREELGAAGAAVEDQAYSPTGTNVLGIVPGITFPGQWLVVSCHMDIQQNSVFGARDDGLGCAAMLELARAAATWTWNRTLVFAFFDEEEIGLVGSSAFVEGMLDRDDVVLAADVNLDPAGLHWPCGDAAGPYPVHLFITESKLGAVPGYQELLDASLASLAAAGVPGDMVTVGTSHAYLSVGELDVLPPGSDDDSFDAADIPSIWFGAPPTDRVGPVQAWGYPSHTPPDTAQLVELRCGSADLLRQGLQVAMDAVLGTLQDLDRVHTVPERT
jgi:hypothetical protein